MALVSFCAIAVLVFCAPPAKADSVGPHWGAAEILARHPGATEVLVASYERIHTGNQPVREAVVLAIADDYAYTEVGSRRIVVDSKLERVISIDLASGSFRHDSIYSVAGFAHYEAWNRVMLRAVLREVGTKDGSIPPGLETFWFESDLGVITRDQPRPEVEQIERSGGTSFSYDGADVVMVTFSKDALSGVQLSSLRRLLRLLTKLHPDILDAIIAKGRLPQTLEFGTPWDSGVSAISYTLGSVRTETALFPLALDAARRYFDDHPFYTTVLPVMEAAVLGAWQPGPKSQDVYFSQIRDAVNRKAWFEAMLLQTEMNLQFADRSGGCTEDMAFVGRCVDLSDLTADLSRDQRVRLYSQAGEIQDSDPVRAVEIWRTIPLEDIPNPYLMGVFAGNVVSANSKAFKKAPVDPYEVFAAAIAANPHLSSFYKDLGDHFRRQLRFDLAWICYDLGRALPNRPAGDVLTHVEQIESQLRQQVPQLF